MPQYFEKEIYMCGVEGEIMKATETFLSFFYPGNVFFLNDKRDISAF